MISGIKNYNELNSCHDEKKRCPVCESLNTKKNGFIHSQINTKRGMTKRKTQRYRCNHCGSSFTSHGYNKRKFISDDIKIKAVRDYVLTKNSLSEVAIRYGVSKSSILNWMKQKSKDIIGIEGVKIPEKDCSGIISVDGKEIKVSGLKKVVYVACDAITGIPICYEVYDKEDRANSLDFFSKIQRLYPIAIKGIVSDFGRGKCFLKVVSEIFPDIPHQICLVHYKRYVWFFLPRTKRSRYFWRNEVLKYMIHRIIDAVDREESLYWFEKFNSYIPFFKASYHKRFIRSVLRNYRWLTQRYEYTFLPKTNNSVENINRQLNRKLKNMDGFKSEENLNHFLKYWFVNYKLNSINNRHS